MESFNFMNSDDKGCALIFQEILDCKLLYSNNMSMDNPCSLMLYIILRIFDNHLIVYYATFILL